MRGKRGTRDQVLMKEDQAVRLAARGLNIREIGQALGLSESEARRKLQKGLARRRGESSAASAWERVDAALAEALRTAYRDHDDAPVGSPQRVGAMKVIVDIQTRIARLSGVELEKPNLALFTPASRDGDGTPTTTMSHPRPVLQQTEEGNRGEVMDLEVVVGRVEAVSGGRRVRSRSHGSQKVGNSPLVASGVYGETGRGR